jgi:hypothetical protein
VVLQIVVAPQVVEARDHVLVEVAEVPIALRHERVVARLVARPPRRAVSSREALAVHVLVHVEDDEEPRVLRPVHALADAAQVVVVVHVGLGLHGGPLDEEPQRVHAEPVADDLEVGRLVPREVGRVLVLAGEVHPAKDDDALLVVDDEAVLHRERLRRRGRAVGGTGGREQHEDERGEEARAHASAVAAAVVDANRARAQNE